MTDKMPDLLEILTMRDEPISEAELMRAAHIRRMTDFKAALEAVRIKNGVREWREGRTTYYQIKWSETK